MLDAGKEYLICPSTYSVIIQYFFGRANNISIAEYIESFTLCSKNFQRLKINPSPFVKTISYPRPEETVRLPNSYNAENKNGKSTTTRSMDNPNMNMANVKNTSKIKNTMLVEKFDFGFMNEITSLVSQRLT